MRKQKKASEGQAPSWSSCQFVNVPPHLRPLLERLGRMADEQGLAAYAVGGCVRDWLLGIAGAVDVDVAIEGEGIAFARLAAHELGASLTPHQQFGTATLELPSEESPQPRGRAGTRTRRSPSKTMRIDVASCRKEVYPQPAAYPKVAPGTLQDDLFRRDFTINAMAMALAPQAFGTLVDPFGGLRDLKARRLRILHPKSFLDDPSRILRAARLVQRYDLSLESHTAQSLRQAAAAGVLAFLNRGRLRKELDRMAEEPRPLACLARLNQWLHVGSRL